MPRMHVTLVLFITCCSTTQVLSTSCDADEARWYKGNLHTHSLWSDGNDFPEMIVDWYVQQGYDFLSLSDHNILADGKTYIFDAPWLFFIPGSAILVVVLGFNLLGEGIREALNPRLSPAGPRRTAS